MDTVAVLSPGDMGHSIAKVLLQSGTQVITCLHDRSPRTRALAREAQIREVPDLEALVEEADIILSVIVPADAAQLATQLSEALRRTGARPVVADCNAIAPGTVQGIALIIEAVGGRFVDAAIIGPPPSVGATTTRIYASGPMAHALLALRDHGLDVRVIGNAIGQASGLKMCYASVTKGLTALAAQQQVAASAMGLTEPLLAELQMSLPDLVGWMERMVAAMPPKAHRWVGEMEEIAATFDSLRLPPGMMLGSAEFYRLTAASSLGAETPESRLRGQTMGAVAKILADELILR